MNSVYRVSDTQRLIVTPEAMNQMRAFAQKRFWHAEAGGVLLGRHLLETSDIVVDEVTTPQSTDLRSRFSFFRSAKHQSVARSRWQANDSTMAYLGLWHTHPEGSPTPSGTDLNDWRSAMAKDTFEGDRLFFPIVGTAEVRIWTMTRAGELSQLQRE